MKKRSNWQRRLVLFAIPAVALLIIAVAVYANYEAGRVAYQAQFDLVIEKRSFDANGQPVTTTVSPAPHIGEPGGYMYTQQYIADGVGGNYPLHTVDTSGVVYIDSKVVRDYTLGDFFAVWGEPLGVNNTLGFKANYSSTLRSPYVWSMCIRTSSGGTAVDIPEPAWGAHVIRDKEVIDLVYSQLTCG